MQRSLAASFAVAGLLAGCSGMSGENGAPSAATEPVPVIVPVTSEIADGSACASDDLRLWVSRSTVDPDTGVADVVIRIDSRSTQRCQIDLTGSLNLDERVEPVVMLQPSSGAEVRVDLAPPGCGDEPAVLRIVPLSVNNSEQEVDVNTIGSCGYELSSVVLLAPATGDCGAADLAARAIRSPDWVVIRNESNAVCRLPVLLGIAVDGTPWPEHDTVFPSSPRKPREPIGVLAPGDVVGTLLSSDTSGGCDPAESAALILSDGIEVPIDEFTTCVFVDPTTVEPYFSSPAAALADFDTIDFDIDRALLLLDPFSLPVGFR